MADARIPLSEIARDPIVAAFLRRGERDAGNAYAVPTPDKPMLIDGAAKQIEHAV